MVDFAGNARFRVQRELGRGGMGVVYEAYDAERGQLVAVKPLRRLAPATLLRFKNEFRSLADVVHPNLVLLYELVSDRDQWFFTMELIHGVDFLSHVRQVDSEAHTASQRNSPTVAYPKGTDRAEGAQALCPAVPDRDASTSDTVVGTLRSRDDFESGGSQWVAPHAPHAPADPALLRPTLVQLVRALMALHDTGHLHRDVKPSNVMVTKEGRVVLLDFGVITNLGDPAAANKDLAGTPSHAAPEQALPGGRVSPASDWYSVGVLLYQALTGELPFVGRTFDNVGGWNHEPIPPIEHAPDAPRDLSRLCMSLLQVDAALRPTGKDILWQLEQRRSRVRRGQLLL